MPSAESYRRHVRQRCRERYGVDIGPDGAREIAAQIARGHGERVRVKIDGREAWRIIWRTGEMETKMLLIYEPDRKLCITALPRDANIGVVDSSPATATIADILAARKS